MSDTPTDGQPFDPADLPSAPPPGTIPPDTDFGQKARAEVMLPAGGGYREVTLTAIVVGILIGIVMNASITYAGLKIGFTLSGSAIAAVLGFGILKMLGRGTIVETNIVQTVASAVNTSNSGVIFTVPVLILLGFTLTIHDENFWLLTLASIAGAIMGTVFIIPLRKQMIDIDRLRFPSPTGVATILKSPGAGIQKFLVLVAGIVIGCLFFLPAAIPDIVKPAEIEAQAPGEPSPLDVLIERGRLTPDQAERTREMATWIERREAPEDLVARGRALTERKELLGELSTLEDESRRDAMLAMLEVFDETIAANPGRGHIDELAILLHHIVSGSPRKAGEQPPDFEDIRDTKMGWAAQPLPGYQDFNLRLPAHYDRDGNLIEHVDHDGDGVPDLALRDKTIDIGRMLGIPGEFALVFAIAPLSLGAGYITGRPGLLVLVGGILAYVIVNPITYNLGWLPADVGPGNLAGWAREVIGKPLGIGMLLGGAMMGIVAAFPAIMAALKSIATTSGGGGGTKGTSSRDEMGLMPLILIGIGGIAMLFLAADLMTSRPINSFCPVTMPAHTVPVDDNIETVDIDGQPLGFASEAARNTWLNTWTEEQRQEVYKDLGMKRGWLHAMPHHVRALLIALIGAVWIWFAGVIIAQCAGMTDWSPISGLALVTVVLVMLLTGTGHVLAAVLLGVALCTAITLAADMMGDLKTGYLVGSKPIKQQTIEICVVGLGPAICMLTLLVIAQTNELGGIDVPAAQADALRSVVLGVQGGELPYALYAMGGLMGVLLGIGGFAGLGVLVGLSVYLPFIYIATYGIGCVLNMLTTMSKGRRFTEEWGVPFAAGLIVGEAVPALIINIIILAQG